MRIITKYPIIKNGRVVANQDLFSNGDGDDGSYLTPAWSSAPTPTAQQVFNTPAPIVTTGTQAPKVTPKSNQLTKSLGKKFDKKKIGKGVMDVLGAFSSSKEEAPMPVVEQKKEMSTTTKVLIGVGGAAVLGTLIYFIVKK